MKNVFHSTNFELLGPIKGNSESGCNLFKVHNFCQQAGIVITRPEPLKMQLCLCTHHEVTQSRGTAAHILKISFTHLLLIPQGGAPVLQQQKAGLILMIWQRDEFLATSGYVSTLFSDPVYSPQPRSTRLLWMCACTFIIFLDLCYIQ